MREIKFRGKRLFDNKEWKYGFYYLYIDNSGKEFHNILNEEEQVTVNEYGATVPAFTNIDKNTLGQYTGLKDVNGKEIYEGDIVLINKEKNIKGIVKYSETYAEFVVVNTNNITDEYEPLADYKKHLEILGNEYENPELLEKEGI